MILVSAVVLTACGGAGTTTTDPVQGSSASPSAAVTLPSTPSPTRRPSPTPTHIPTTTPTAQPTPTPSPTPEPTPESTAEAEAPAPQLDPAWEQALTTIDGARVGVVNTDSLYIRSAPSLGAPILDTTYNRHPVVVYEAVPGDGVDGVPVWYRVGDGRFVSAAFVQPFTPPAPAQTFSGRWVDVNLSAFYAVAYQDDRPVYAAIITAGRDDRTPTGVYQISYRVRTETMDSATVGIPKGHPEYYYLQNVEFTQYFKTGGYALHGNYWTPPWAFGGFTSNGCVGFLNADAEWFWNFLDVGSTVSIHF